MFVLGSVGAFGAFRLHNPSLYQGAVPRGVVRVVGIQSGAANATTWALTVSILDDEPSQTPHRPGLNNRPFFSRGHEGAFHRSANLEGSANSGAGEALCPLFLQRGIECLAHCATSSRLQAELKNKTARRAADRESVNDGRSRQAGSNDPGSPRLDTEVGSES
jgi:hypothetical protein